MSAESSAAAQSPRLNRRQFIKATAGATVAAGVGTGATMPGSPIGRADALPCGGLCVGAAAAAAGSVAVGWLLREKEVIGADDPPEGLTPETLKQQVFDTAQTRESTNASTFTDNKNIISAGVKNTAYSEGKLAAIKKLNEEAQKSEVLSAGRDAANQYLNTPIKNFLKSWGESVQELVNLFERVDSHPDVSPIDVMAIHPDNVGAGDCSADLVESQTTTYELPDGSTFDLKSLHYEGSFPGGPRDFQWSPANFQNNEGSGDSQRISIGNPAADGQPVEYLRHSDWENILNKLETAATEVNDGLSLWVDEVYSKVQAGELETEDLLTSRELAQLSSGEKGALNQATADLMALNIPVNLEREATVSLSSTDTTLYGMLGVTGEVTIDAGDTIDPSTDSHDYYLTYDVSEAHGDWTAYNDGVDGGVVTFTSEPHPGVTYSIETIGSGSTTTDTSGETATPTGGETVTVPSSDFSETDAGGEWTADLSEELETDITEISSVTFYSEKDEGTTETVQLEESFTVEAFTNTKTGEEVDTASYRKPTEPETDNNYITQEEWEQRQKAYQEQIETYEEAKNSGGGGISLPGIGDVGPGGMVGGIVALAVAVFGLGKLN